MDDRHWPRAILHVDMDAFFASVEQLDHPEWRGKPVIVGGPAEGRGVVSAASYEARRYGVHSAQPTAVARQRCPHGIFVVPSGGRYSEVSRQIRSIFERVTPLVEPLSIDEAFLDITGCQRLYGPPLRIARAVKTAIRNETGLTASVGGAATKFVAKLASDLEKPDGLVLIPEEETRERLAPLEVERLFGVGPACLKTLRRLGIRTIDELAAWPRDSLEKRFGQMGGHLYRLSHGMDPREVEPGGEAKSLSNEHTFAEDVLEISVLRERLEYLADKVASRARAAGVEGRIATLKLRYDDFTTITRRRVLARPTHLARDLIENALALLRERTDAGTRPARLIGVGLADLRPEGTALQGSLFDDHERHRHESLERTTDRIRERLGRDAIRRGVHVRPPSAKDDETR